MNFKAGDLCMIYENPLDLGRIEFFLDDGKIRLYTVAGYTDKNPEDLTLVEIKKIERKKYFYSLSDEEKVEIADATFREEADEICFALSYQFPDDQIVLYEGLSPEDSQEIYYFHQGYKYE